MQNLTSGNITKLLITLTIPLLVANILQQLFNTADTIFVSNYVGDLAFSALGVSTSVSNLFIYILVGMSVGFSILYANEFGAEDYPALRNSIFITLQLGIAFSFVLMAVGFVFTKEILELIRTPFELVSLSYSYLHVVFGGLIVQFLFYFASALLRAIGKTDTTLYALIIAIIAKIILNYILVVIFGLGLNGTAYATISSQIVVIVWCLWYIPEHIPVLWLKKEDMHMHFAILRQAANFGSSAAAQQCSVLFGKLLVQSAVNAMGSIAVAAFTAAVCIEQLILAVSDSGGAAVSIFIAQNSGGGNNRRVFVGLYKGLKIMIITAAFLGTVLFFTADYWMELLLSHDNKPGLTIATRYLNIMSLCFIFSFTASTLQGYFRGIGRVFLTLIASTIQIVLRVGLTYSVPLNGYLDNIALATGVGWLAMIALEQRIVLNQRKAKKEKQKAPANLD